MKLLLLAATLALAAFVPSTLTAAEAPIRHVVCFKFKKDADPAKVQHVVEAFAALKGKIPLIQKLETGTNSSPENLNKGFTHIWIATFKTAPDRDAYLIHPDHKAFAAGLRDVLDEPFVVDFVASEVGQ